MESFVQDLRYAVRQLTSNPGFTVVALLTIVLGVGANTAVFSVANWLVYRPTPGVVEEDRMVTAFFWSGVSHPHFERLARGVPAFSGAAGQDLISVALQVEGGPAKNATAAVVSPTYFSVLGEPVQPGRIFSDEEIQAARGAPVAVISYALWKESFGGRPDIVGRSLRLNGKSVTITGVAARGFDGTDRYPRASVWIPHTALMALNPRQGEIADPAVPIYQEMVARLAPGATLVQAETQFRTVLASLLADVDPRRREGRPPILTPGLGLQPTSNEYVQGTLKVLSIVSVVLLLIASANLANLFLFRTVRLRAEAAVRRALGAGAVRLARQALTEILLLSTVGALGAMGFAAMLMWLLEGFSVRWIYIDQVPLDGRVLGFGLLAALTVGLVAGLVPIVLGDRLDIVTVLKSSAAKGSTRRPWVRGVMATIQLAACLALLVGALLLTGTLRNLRGVNVGFRPEGLSAFAVNPSLLGYTPEQTRDLVDRSVARIRAIPGVDDVTFGPFVPFGGGGMFTLVCKDVMCTRPEGAAGTAAFVSESYFRTMGIPVLRGRAFTEAEATATGATVTVLSTKLARDLFGDADPIGRVVVSGKSQPFTVIGIVPDARWSSVVGRDMSSGAMFYRPNTLDNSPMLNRFHMIVRSGLPSNRIRPQVLAAIAEVDPSVAVYPDEMSERIDRTLSEQRLFARVLSMLTLLAVVLSGVGLYGLVAASVAERRKEFGIRFALGAQAERVMNDVVGQAARVSAAGVLLGVVGAFGVGRLIASRLFGVAPLELHVYLAAISVLVVVVLAASVVPAWAATKVDPMVALRSE